MGYLKIVPAQRNDGESGPTVCNGTRVLTSEGVEVKGVTSIALFAHLNSLWTATITVNVQPPDELMAELTEVSVEDMLDVTTIADLSRVYRKVPTD